MSTPLYSTKKSDFFALFEIISILKLGLYIYDLNHDTTNSKYPTRGTTNR